MLERIITMNLKRFCYQDTCRNGLHVSYPPPNRERGHPAALRSAGAKRRVEEEVPSPPVVTSTLFAGLLRGGLPGGIGRGPHHHDEGSHWDPDCRDRRPFVGREKNAGPKTRRSRSWDGWLVA